VRERSELADALVGVARLASCSGGTLAADRQAFRINSGTRVS
jgi:hypothetical protein